MWKFLAKGLTLLKDHLAVSSQRTDTIKEINQSQYRVNTKGFPEGKGETRLERDFLSSGDAAGLRLLIRPPGPVFSPGGGATPPSLRENITKKMIPG